MNDKYTILKREFLSDNGCYLTTYCHNKTKALVIYIELDEESLSSLVMVRTPSYNDKGIYHIIEHCVLSGSKKYNCKDPFKEIEKRSLSSYMNAITFADKTIFPFTTVNKTDFYNVLDVYLDGIFNPLFLKHEEVIYKEGIHFEFQNGKIIPNGIVYNEMLGVEGDANSKINLAIRRHIYQGSPYSYFAGGLTDEIRTVNPKMVCDYYLKSYYPSNMSFVVSGPVDINRYLELLDSYIAKYSYKKPIMLNYLNINVARHKIKLKLDKKSDNIISLGYRLPFLNDSKAILALAILNYLLIDIEGSRLKMLLEDRGIKANIYTDIDDSYHPLCQINLEFEGKIQKRAIKIIDDFLKQEAYKYIDKKRISSTIEFFRFMACEEDYDSLPKGLALSILLTNDLLYDDLSFSRLKRGSLYDELEGELDTGYFLNILNEAYIKNNSYVQVIGKSGHKKSRKKQYIPSLSLVNEEKIKLNSYLKSKDDISNLKGLSLDAINKNPIKYNYTKNNKLIYIKNDKNSISYLKLMFDISDFTLDELSIASILSHGLAIFKMKNMSCDEFMVLANEIGGGITTNIAFYTDRATKKMRRYFVCELSFLEAKYEENIKLLKEILFNTLFDNDDILKCLKALRMELTADTNYFKERVYRLEAFKSYNQIGFFLDVTQGTLFIQNLDKMILDEGRAEILKSCLNRMLDKGRMMIASYAKNDISGRVLNDISPDERVSTINSYDLNPDFKSKGLAMEGISSNMLVIPVSKESPASYIMTRIIEDFLWQAIRNENGAYHIQAYVDTSRNIIMYSRQDPNILKSYDIMLSSLDFVINKVISEEELKDYIISYFSATTAYTSAFDSFNLILRTILEGYSYEVRKENRMGILSLTEKQIKDYACYIKSIINKAIKISIYSREEIKKSDFFDEIKEIDEL